MAVVHDHVVVGSGITGSEVANVLVQSGAKVMMIDGGIKEQHYADMVPYRSFLDIRKSDPNQHRWMLGDQFEGVPWRDAATTLTPPRQYIVEGTEHWLPVQGSNFARMESLAWGGLGSGWGAGCAVYNRTELEAIGMQPELLEPAYKAVGQRIGIAAQIDDMTPYCGRCLEDTHDPLKMDDSIADLYKRYLELRDSFTRLGIVMGKMPMAVTTRPHGTRGANPYTDMEFWSDPELSVYRPWMTVEPLLRKANFEYCPSRLVTKFKEQKDCVAIHSLSLDDGEERIDYARRLVLCTGSLGSARIVMRSLSNLEERPILTNAWSLALCVHPRRIGKTLGERRTSLGQLEMLYDPMRQGLDVRMVSFFTYRSLLLFKLVREMPLAMADALPILRRLAPALVVAAINHPDTPNCQKRVVRVPDTASPTGDALKVEYERSVEEIEDDQKSEKVIGRALRKLGAPVLKKKPMPPGSTVHYGGTLPFCDSGRPGTIAADGRLAGTQRVYVADGSCFRYLPANGLTFTLMAWAHVVAQGLLARKTG